MARLLLTVNNKVITTYAVPPSGELGIGRHPKNQIVIESPMVSGNHAKVRQDAEGLRLIDLGSTNGTFLNDERVKECRLAHQDWITIGKHLLIVDLYESLSLDVTVEMLRAGTSRSKAGLRTVLLDIQPGQTPAQAIDALTFGPSGREDYELLKSSVTIGRGRNADIAVGGFWSFLAGEPAASIEKRGTDYFLTYHGGMLKPKVNGLAVKGTARLNHQDMIKIGALQMQIKLGRHAGG